MLSKALSISQSLITVTGPVGRGFGELSAEEGFDIVEFYEGNAANQGPKAVANSVFLMAVCLSIAIGLGELLRRHVLQRCEDKQMYNIGILLFQWTATSVAMNVLNKTLMSTMHLPCFITSVQLFIVFIVMTITLLIQKPTVRPRAVIFWMCVPFTFTCMLLSSFFALQSISLSLMMIVRNITPFVSLPLEMAFRQKNKIPVVNSWTICSGIFLILGTVMYSTAIPSMAMVGVCFAVANMLLAVFDRLVQGHLLETECKDLPLEVCTWLTNLIGLVPAVAIGYVNQEFQALRKPEHLHYWRDGPTIGILLISGPLGLGICYYGLALTREISATSMLMAQTVGKILTCVMGIILFGDPIRSPWLGIGLAFSLGGSFLYGKAQVSKEGELNSDLKYISNLSGPGNTCKASA